MTKRTYGPALFVLIVSGCGTVAGIKDDPIHLGKRQVFKTDQSEVLGAARLAILERGMSIEETYPVDNGQAIIAKSNVTFWSYGEIVRIIVRGSTATGETEVWVHQKRVGKLNVTAKTNYAESIFASIELRLTE